MQTNSYAIPHYNFSEASSEKLLSIRRLPMPHMPDKAKKLFKITEEQLYRSQKLMEKMQPQKTVANSSLHGRDRELGFKYEDLVN